MKISASVIARLPRYYRFFSDLSENGVTRISSNELAEMMGLTASKIRQDLNCFGGFGHQGYGYNPVQLCEQLRDILALPSKRKAILIGAGNLGRAVTNQIAFADNGFDLIGIFDSDPMFKGMKIKDIPIMSDDVIPKFCIDNNPEMAVLCLTESKAPEMVDLLYSLGIRGFWNFSHFDIKRKYPDAIVENVHLSDSVMLLSYKMIKKKDEET